MWKGSWNLRHLGVNVLYEKWDADHRYLGAACSVMLFYCFTTISTHIANWFDVWEFEPNSLLPYHRLEGGNFASITAIFPCAPIVLWLRKILYLYWSCAYQIICRISLISDSAHWVEGTNNCAQSRENSLFRTILLQNAAPARGHNFAEVGLGLPFDPPERRTHQA